MDRISQEGVDRLFPVPQFEARGQHLLIEAIACERGALNSKVVIERMMQEIALRLNWTILGSVFHEFQPQGITGLLLIAESHISVHTWPEHNYAAIDVYTCGIVDRSLVVELIRRYISAENVEMLTVNRGAGPLSVVVPA